MTVQPDPTADQGLLPGGADKVDSHDSATDADGSPGSRPERMSGELVAGASSALFAGVPEAALATVADDASLPPDVKSALHEILSGGRAPHEAAADIGDVLRAQGGPGSSRAVNEFYRAAFYLGDGWEEAARNPLFARFVANKAGGPFDKWVHYFDIYQEVLQPFVGTRARVLEIGVFHGGGLEQLRFLLGDGAHLVGIDVDVAAQAACAGRFLVEVGDQADPQFLQRVVAEHGPFDVVIDDGGHTMSQQIGSLEALFPTLAPGGRYLVEDTHTSYWGEYQDSDVTFIDWVKERLDDLNAYHHSRSRSLPVWATEVRGIHAYDSVVVLDKGRHYPPFAEVAGNGSALLGARHSELELLQYRAAVNVRTSQLTQTQKQATVAVADARRKLEDADSLYRTMESRHAQDLESVETVREELLRARAELEGSRDELQRSKGDLQRAQRSLQDLRTSKSWRWTSPVRRAMRDIGR